MGLDLRFHKHLLRTQPLCHILILGLIRKGAVY